MSVFSSEPSQMWDLSQASSFSQLPDDDFLALLQKQFPAGAQPSFLTAGTGINPQSLDPLPILSPPDGSDSTDSPSPPPDDHDLSHKRKASVDDDDEGPSHKSQATSSKKNAGNKQRKSSGTGDDSRLMKRKEQNRAAQRAFRERKEKHVKDLEDKVSALEAKNDEAHSENSNLRDLLSRLQSENMMLKQQNQQFTFSIPKQAGSSSPQQQNPQNTFGNINSPLFTMPQQSSPMTSFASPGASSSASPPQMNPLEWSSLNSFDPNMLNLLDDATPQEQTATSTAMNTDFDFNNNDPAPPSQYITIASNPMFSSFMDVFEPGNENKDSNPSSSDVSLPSANPPGPSDFDMNLLSAWPAPPAATSDAGSGTLDDLFGSMNGTSIQSPMDFSSFLNNNGSSSNQSLSSISPVVHNQQLTNKSFQSIANQAAGSPSSSSSSPNPSPMFSAHASPESDTTDPSSGSGENHDQKKCPKSRQDYENVIKQSGSSAFAPPTPESSGDSMTNVRRSSADGNTILCNGSKFPSIKKSEDNIDVMNAWKIVREDPKYKDIEMNALCSEFAAKARCDGTKVVLEPSSVVDILEKLNHPSAAEDNDAQFKRFIFEEAEEVVARRTTAGYGNGKDKASAYGSGNGKGQGGKEVYGFKYESVFGVRMSNGNGKGGGVSGAQPYSSLSSPAESSPQPPPVGYPSIMSFEL